MNIKQSTLAAAVTAALALGVTSQAHAYLYGAANLSINDFRIAFTPSQPTVSRFDFTLTNTATLNGVSAINTATCGGTPGPGNNCTSALGSMDAAATNAPGSTGVIRTENAGYPGGEFTMYGPTVGGNWSNSDSLIAQAELVQLGQPTITRNIAEARLAAGGTAASTSKIESVTGFTLNFTLESATTGLSLSFLADPELFAAISGQSPGTYSASASLSATFTLRNDNNPAIFASWAPRGTRANDCIALGLTCTETADTQDLNTNVGVTTNNTSSSSSYDPNVLNLTAFGINISGLTAGNYTLTLAESKSTRLSSSVPEPGALALPGIGLVGMGFSSRRRKSV